MNPFDLKGPEFLGFYVGLGAVVFALLALASWRLRRRAGRAPLPRDPYAVAYLRGGARDVARVATLALLAKTLLRVPDGKRMLERSDVAPPSDLRPIERAVLLAFENGATLRTAGNDREVRALADETRASLEASGHWMTAERRRTYRTAIAIGAVVLLGTAATKLVVALSRGRTNVTFLIVLALIYGWILVSLARVRATNVRKSAIRDVRALLGRSSAVQATSSSLRDDPEMLYRAAALGIIGGPFSVPGGVRRNADSPGSDAGGTWGGCGGGGGGGGDGGGGSGCGGGGCGGCSSS